MKLYFLKLGGSLITDKNRPHTPRLDVLARLAQEISAARENDPGLSLLLGHGAGSFAHVPASRYRTRQGVHTAEEWRGFVEVWQEAVDLNHLVTEALHQADLPVISLPPSASVVADGARFSAWDLTPIRLALQAGLIPLVYGDVIFDISQGGTIFSTEDLFAHLARYLHPQRVLLAGIEPGVWADYPACTRLLEEITPGGSLESNLQGSAATDVTGGMASKVAESLSLVKDAPEVNVLIFSGKQPGMTQRALGGEILGTMIHQAYKINR